MGVQIALFLYILYTLLPYLKPILTPIIPLIIKEYNAFDKVLRFEIFLERVDG